MKRNRRKKSSRRIPSAVTRWLKKSNPGFRRASSVRVRKLKGGGITVVPVKRNVAAGFMDEEGIFHPIRASYDYSPSRAGEKGKFKPTQRKKARKR